MVNELVDIIFKKYKKAVNMSFSELKVWSKTKLSRIDNLSRAPIKRNLRLLATPKMNWGVTHVRDAIRIIKFIKKNKGRKKGVVISNGLSKRDIVLKNWGFNIKKKR